MKKEEHCMGEVKERHKRKWHNGMKVEKGIMEGGMEKEKEKQC